MHIDDVLAMATIMVFCILGIVAPTLFVVRAVRTADTLERAWLFAGAFGFALFALLQLELVAHTVAPIPGLAGWVAVPLAIYATATAWLYTSVALSLWAGLSLTLMILGAAARRESHRTRR